MWYNPTLARISPIKARSLPKRRIKDDPRENSLQMYLRFNEGNGRTVFDYSKYRRDGVIYNANWGKNGVDRGLWFDGINSYVETPIFSVPNNLTFTAWAYYIDGQPTGNFGGIVCNLNGKDDYNRILVNPTTIRFEIRIVSTIYYHDATTNINLQNAWHHYVVTYNGSYVKIYLDGNRIYTKEQTGDLNWWTRKPTIGWGSISAGLYHFKGAIDEVRAYNRVLADQEIRMIYENEKNNYY